MEDIPGAGEMSVGRYESPDSEKDGFSEIKIVVTDPGGGVVLQQQAKKKGAHVMSMRISLTHRLLFLIRPFCLPCKRRRGI